MFGLHIASGLDTGKLQYKAGGVMAASDRLEIKIKGKQTHGSRPWAGIDPVVVSAQVIMGLQTIISRQTDLTREAAVITVAQVNGGVRNNIIPEEVTLIGTIRTLDVEMQKSIHSKIHRTVVNIAESAGGTAEVEHYPRAIPSPTTIPSWPPKCWPAWRSPPVKKMRVTVASTGAEDFAFYAKKYPFFFFLGGKRSQNEQLWRSSTPPRFLSGWKAALFWG